ncbi:ferredoxin--NADP reductase [Wenzhouxiangella marina]|nr:ferredoxin--NADP reductase [Wenzhouxiangella marina]MBB6086978.1 ferredoxin--NADP+ reductase [Wenzhouxiangella marina]
MNDRFRRERVLDVHHWNERLFSIRTTRDPGFRFESGQFIMVGLEVDGKPLLRAYSIASASWEEELEFYSIKVPDGPLTSRLQHVKPGDELLLSKKPTGTLLISDLRPGPRLYLLGTGTGLAPYLSIIKDPETYERFDTVIVAHGVRQVSDLAYREMISHDLPKDPILGEIINGHLLYYPAVTREPFIHEGRLTDLLDSGQMTKDLGLPAFDPANDRVMLCGSMDMIKDFRTLLDGRGFRASQFIGDTGDYVFERAFVG